MPARRAPGLAQGPEQGPANRPVQGPLQGLAQRCARALLLLAACAAAPPAARAHDTWLSLLPGVGPLRLALSTGDRYPLAQTAVGSAPEHAACRQGRAADGVQRWLSLLRHEPQATLLRLDAPAPATAAARGAGQPVFTCWAQLPPHETVLQPEQVQQYLREIRAAPALREAWARQQRQGLPWRERWVKHARIELGPHPGGSTPLGLDIVLDDAPLRVGQPLRLQLLQDGRPVPRQAVEWVAADAPAGLWLLTDDAGRAELRAPLAGQWLLRSTVLWPDPRAAGLWHSRFATLALQIRP